MDWDDGAIRSVCEKKTITSDDVMTLSQYFNRDPAHFLQLILDGSYVNALATLA